MNYNKLQLSFVLLLIMTIIQLLTGLLIIKKLWLILFSLVAATLCIIGLLYTMRKETEAKEKDKDSDHKNL